MHSSALQQQFIAYMENYIALTNEDVPRTQMPYIHTHSGRHFYHGAPRPEDITVEDIAHSLSRICRFTGHVNVPLYSVAQHSVHVSYFCDPWDALDGLLHDGTEAYCTDISSPLKGAPGMEAYKHYEALTAKAVYQAFDLQDPEPVSVKAADRLLALTEMRDLFDSPSASRWADEKARELGITLPNGEIVAWPQEVAERRFLERYHELNQVDPEIVSALRDTHYLKYF